MAEHRSSSGGPPEGFPTHNESGWVDPEPEEPSAPTPDPDGSVGGEAQRGAPPEGFDTFPEA